MNATNKKGRKKYKNNRYGGRVFPTRYNFINQSGFLSKQAGPTLPPD